MQSDSLLALAASCLCRQIREQNLNSLNSFLVFAFGCELICCLSS